MKSIDLNGEWKMKSTKDDEWISAKVPGTVYSDLMSAQLAPDPYTGKNEEEVLPFLEQDYEYTREFSLPKETFSHDKIELVCEGLDTLCEISINEEEISKTNNMHRSYCFDIKKYLQEGKNSIKIVFRSPIKFVEKILTQPQKTFSRKGVEHIRKAHCMFGWDWGIALPDMGIWRSIYIRYFDFARIEEVLILQSHTENGVFLDIGMSFQNENAANLTASIEVISPNQEETVRKTVFFDGTDCNIEIKIDSPQLWWPAGFGPQPLYTVNVQLLMDGISLDETTKKIGLRTIKLIREEDQWGKSYEFEINGKPLFLKGSNLIIEDALLNRNNCDRTQKLVKSCVDSNFNCIRVWGGALYPPDYFYEICDEYGIFVFQDLMFANNFYPTDDDFLNNIVQEIKDNVRRIRHHACLGIWCGNNEAEVIYYLMTSKQEKARNIREMLCISEACEGIAKKSKESLLKIFYDIVPQIIKSEDPQACFVNSSAIGISPGEVSPFDDFNHGDAHYYLPLDDMAEYTDIINKDFRFISEYGFQSYPDIKTISAFAAANERHPFSDTMLCHQKSHDGNNVIETYMLRDYKYPRNFEMYVYASQILVGDILKYAVEHQRRSSGKCMGAITWQLNDCWPVISWSGIDYYGRWKAQQYYSKRFFSPILLSALKRGYKVELWVTNDRLNAIQGAVSWKLRGSVSKIIREGKCSVNVSSCACLQAAALDFSEQISENNQRELYVEFSIDVGGKTESYGTLLFVKPKDFSFANPNISTNVSESENEFIIEVKSSAFAKSVALSLQIDDCIFSDNFFDLSAGANKIISVDKDSLSCLLELKDFASQLTAVCVYNI